MTKKSKIVVCIIVVLAFITGTVSGIFIGKNLQNVSLSKDNETFYSNKEFSFEITAKKIMNVHIIKPFDTVEPTLDCKYLMIEYTYENKLNKTVLPNDYIVQELFDNGLKNTNHNDCFDDYFYKKIYVIGEEKNAFDGKDKYCYQGIGELQSGAKGEGRMYYLLNDNYNDTLELNISNKNTKEIYHIFKIETQGLKQINVQINTKTSDVQLNEE